MKIILNRAQKVILLQSLSDGFIYLHDLNTIKGIDTIIPDRPMSRIGYLELLKKLQCEDYDQEIIDKSIIDN